MRDPNLVALRFWAPPENDRTRNCKMVIITVVVQVNTAACGCVISLIPPRLGAIVPVNC